jgi:hypothetical protein
MVIAATNRERDAGSMMGVLVMPRGAMVPHLKLFNEGSAELGSGVPRLTFQRVAPVSAWRA